MTQEYRIPQQALSKNPLFPQKENEEDNAKTEQNVKKPNFKCFCCSDTGLIQPNLVKQVIPDYNFKSDRMPVCNRCEKRNRFVQGSEIYPSLDFRVSRSTCEVFHKQMEKVWDEPPSEIAKEAVKFCVEHLTKHFSK